MAKSRSKKEGVFRVENPGEPIRLSKLDLLGFAAESVLAGQDVKVCTRIMITSDDPMFHIIADNLAGVVERSASNDEKSVDLRRITTGLVIIRSDKSAELWLDSAAMSLDVMAKRAVAAGSPIFEHDIADIVGMNFPLVGLAADQQVICFFRVGWRFALFFDLDRAKPLDLAKMRRDLGTLFRMLQYRNVYDAVGNPSIFDRLIVSGWFPFVEILGSEFRELVKACDAGWDLGEVENKILSSFSSGRLKHVFDRWMGRPHFAGKKPILKAAISAFKRKDSVAAIKIALTEIEGVLRDAYRCRTGKNAKLPKLLQFAVRSAEEKAGAPNTLLFPQAFGRYLATYTFGSFNPETATGTVSSRHAVGHGAAEPDAYTQVRALQALLTLDQLAFYT